MSVTVKNEIAKSQVCDIFISIVKNVKKGG